MIGNPCAEPEESNLCGIVFHGTVCRYLILSTECSRPGATRSLPFPWPGELLMPGDPFRRRATPDPTGGPDKYNLHAVDSVRKPLLSTC